MRRFTRYAVIGVSTFLLDFALLYLLTTYGGVPYYISTPIAFLSGVSVNYPISRRYAFSGTRRSWSGGYLCYMAAAIVAAFITSALVVAFVEYAGLYYLHARIVVAIIVGIAGYFFNYYVNFRLQDTK